MVPSASPTQQSSSHSRDIPCPHKGVNDDESQRCNCFIRNGVNAISEAKGSNTTTGPVTHSGDISITGKSHKKKPDKMKETQQIIIMDNVISLTMYTGPYSSYTGSIKRDLEYSRATSVHGL
jgi:hypothetical protein